MKYLLDTHTLIWWDSTSRQLSLDVSKLLQTESWQIGLSVINIWEIQIKHQLGRLTLNKPLADIIQDQLTTHKFQMLPVYQEHVMALDQLPLHHKDPFDRLLVAQAKTSGAILLTNDPLIKQYLVPTLW